MLFCSPDLLCWPWFRSRYRHLRGTLGAPECAFRLGFLMRRDSREYVGVVLKPTASVLRILITRILL